MPVLPDSAFTPHPPGPRHAEKIDTARSNAERAAFAAHKRDDEKISSADLQRALDAALDAALKPTNPKDMQGIKKAPLSCVSTPVLMEVSLGMLEGALKYGRHNYRTIGVRASIYFDATMRHLTQWWEGEDYDMDSKVALHHVSKAIASLTVLRDAMIQGKFTDDRPPKSKVDWAELNAKAEELLKAYPAPVPPHTEK